MNQMELKFSADCENISFARGTVASFLLRYNLTIDEAIEFKTIVSEAVSNAIIHGYRYNKNNDVYMKVIVVDDIVQIAVEDKGCGIDDIEEARKPLYSSSKNLEHAGMGLTIIESLSDEFSIESRKDVGTKLLITKRLNLGKE